MVKKVVVRLEKLSLVENGNSIPGRDSDIRLSLLWDAPNFDQNTEAKVIDFEADDGEEIDFTGTDDEVIYKLKAELDADFAVVLSTTKSFPKFLGTFLNSIAGKVLTGFSSTIVGHLIGKIPDKAIVLGLSLIHI